VKVIRENSSAIAVIASLLAVLVDFFQPFFQSGDFLPPLDFIIAWQVLFE